MPMPITALCSSSSPILKIPSFSSLALQTRKPIAFPIKTLNHPFNPIPTLGFSTTRKQLGLFLVKAEYGEEEISSVDDARVQSTTPERFKLRREGTSYMPPRWALFVALGLVVYSWRAVLFELANWQKVVGFFLDVILALVFYIINDPINSLIRCMGTVMGIVRAFYSGIVANAPVSELTTIIVLTSAVLSIGEVASPKSVSSQPNVLIVSSLIGYAAVKSYISEPLFWILLAGLYVFSRLIKKRDDVTSTLPVAAVLVAVGEVWVRIVVMVSYLALAISHHSKQLLEGKVETETAGTGTKVPAPLLCVAFAIGIRLAATWAGRQHLTWMTV